MQPITISVKDAVALSGLAERTIHRHIAEGTLVSVTVGRRRLVRRDSLMTLLGGD